MDNQIDVNFKPIGLKRKNNSPSGSKQENDQICDILAVKSVIINEKFIVNMQSHKVISVENKKCCKILKLSTDYSHLNIFEILKKLDSSEYSNLLIFIIEVENAALVSSKNSSKEIKMTSILDDVQDLLLKFAKDRPIVLQLSSVDEKLIKFYFKDQRSSILQEVENNIQRNSESILDFPLFLNSFLNNELEVVKNLLLESLDKVKNSSLIIRFLRILEKPEEFWTKIVLKCAENGSVNDFLASIDSQISNSRILNPYAQQWLCNEISEKLPSAQMNDLMEVDDLRIDSNDDKIPNLNMDESTNKTSVLYKAVQHNNLKVINYLISYCTHLIQQYSFDHQEIITSAALKENLFDVLCELIKVSDFPFPEVLNANELIHQGLEDIVAERSKFHESIEDEDFSQILEFIGNNMNLRIAYNVENDSAMQQALYAKNFKVYYFLKSYGFYATEFRNIRDVITDPKEIKRAEKCKDFQMKKNVKKGLNSEHKSVNLLCNRSFIHNRKTSNEKEKQYRKQIRKWLEDINEIKSGSEFLNVAASCEDLKIIFDFESETDENVSLGIAGSSGGMYPSQKWIFIGAKSENENRYQKVKGVLAHELCHYVMKLVYENNENPYYKHCKNIIEKFKTIVVAINKWLPNGLNDPDDECGGIISTVFRWYAADDFHAELIVRVIQILAYFDNDEEKSNSLSKKFDELFKFWEECVVPEMKTFDLKYREKIRKINRIFGLLKNVNCFNLEFVAEKDFKISMDIKLYIITTNNPKLMLINIYKFMQFQYENLTDVKNIFINPKMLNNSEIFEDFDKVQKKYSGLSIIIDSSDNDCDELKKLKINVGSSWIFVVQNVSQAAQVKENLQNINKINLIENEINYTWNDLKTESQEQLLHKKINLQNNPQVTLLDLFKVKSETEEETWWSANSFLLERSNSATNQQESINRSIYSEVIDYTFLNLILKEEIININNVPNNCKEFSFLYSERNFVNSENLSFSENEFLLKVKKDKYVLISDIAGNGKSWAMKNISQILIKLNPTNWITYVDLKQYIKKFNKQKMKKLEFSTFMTEFILKFNSNFEAKIFQKLYDIGKVFIIFDGFDEIAPDYAEFVSNLAKLFEQNGGNQLWIATRDYFRVNLQQELQVRDAYKLDEFSINNGIELIAKSWIVNEPEINMMKLDESITKLPKFKEFIKMASEIVKQIPDLKYNKYLHKYSIGMPQIYKIIAEISKDNKEATKSFKQTNLYKLLVQELYWRWGTQKGEIRNQSNKKSQEFELSFYKFHQYLAILSLFPEYLNAIFVNYDKSEWSNEEVIACGIVAIINGEYHFLHETFREFFLADFLSNEIKKSSFCQEVFDIFIKVLSIEKFGTIRMFLNETLDSFDFEKIEQKIKTNDCKLIFREMDSFADIYICEHNQFIDIIFRVLNSKSNDLSFVLIKNADKILINPKKYVKFQELLFSHCNDDHLKSLVTEHKVFFALIGSNLNMDYFEDFLSKIESKFGNQTIIEGIKMIQDWEGNILLMMCLSSDFDSTKFKKFLKILNKFLRFKDFFNLIYNCNYDEKTFLQSVFRNMNKIFEYWTEIKESMNIELFKKLVSKQDLKGRNILSSSLEIDTEDCKLIWKELFELFDLRTLKEMIIEVAYNRIDFMETKIWKYDDKIEFIIEFLILKFGRKKLVEFFRTEHKYKKKKEDIYEKNVDSLFEISFNCYKFLWQTLEEACETEQEFLEILSKIYFARKFKIIFPDESNVEIFIFMIEKIEKLEPCDEVKRIISHKVNTENIFSKTVLKTEQNFEHFKRLWKIYQQNFSFSDFIKLVNIPFYEIVRWSNFKLIELTWNEIKSREM